MLGEGKLCFKAGHVFQQAAATAAFGQRPGLGQAGARFGGGQERGQPLPDLRREVQRAQEISAGVRGQILHQRTALAPGQFDGAAIERQLWRSKESDG